MAKTPKRAKGRKRAMDRVRKSRVGRVVSEMNRKPTKDERIKNLQLGYKAMEKMRDGARADYANMCTARDKMKGERDNLVNLLNEHKQVIERLTAEANRQLGYIQRIQEIDLMHSPRIQRGTNKSTNGASTENVSIISEPALSPTFFGSISDVISPRERSKADRVRDMMDASGRYDHNRPYGYPNRP